MTDPHNSYDSDEQPYREDVSYDQEEHDEYRDSMFDEPNWSDRATKIICRAVALVALVFSVLFAFEIL